MYERFSDRARHAMALANSEAARLNHSFLAPGHLMLGLIGEGRCVATEALQLLDVDLGKVRQEVGSRMTPGNGAGGVGARTHTKEFKDIIAKAIDEARRFEHRYVGTEHLVLGLLQEPNGLPAQVLQQQGVSLDKLRKQVVDLLESDLKGDHDLAHSRHGDFEWVHQQELSKAFRSSKFWHTMILAVDTANRGGAGEVEPHHLLVALLRDESTGVAKVLKSKGVTLDWVREQVASGAMN